MEEVEKIQKGLMHRPFNPNSTDHLHFLDQLKAKIIALQEEYPHLKF
jgi:hypothetical protein